MIVDVGCAWARVEANPDERDWVVNYLTFRSTAVRGPDTVTPLYQHAEGALYAPAGLAARLVVRAREANTEAILRKRYTRANLPRMVNFSTDTVLRRHQEEALRIIEENDGRCIIQHCTGSGKGTLIAYLCGAYATQTICVVVTSRRLAEEMKERIWKVARVRVGVIGAGNNDRPKRVMVVVTNSLPRQKKEWFARFDVVIGDEVHGAASQGYWTSLMRFTSAPTRIGFSATVTDRADQKTAFVIAAFGPIVHRYTPAQAEADGVIAKALLRMPPFWHPHHSVANGYADWERTAIAENEGRNRKIAMLLDTVQTPALVFVRLTDHAEELTGLIRETTNKNVAYVHGKMPIAELNRSLRRLGNGDLDVVVSAPILKQGVDIPSIRTVINASAMKATIDTIQKLGRGSRIAEGKVSFDVYDIADMGCGCKGDRRHASCRWLETHTEERRDSYEKYGYSVRAY